MFDRFVDWLYIEGKQCNKTEETDMSNLYNIRTTMGNFIKAEPTVGKWYRGVKVHLATTQGDYEEDRVFARYEGDGLFYDHPRDHSGKPFRMNGTYIQETL